MISLPAILLVLAATIVFPGQVGASRKQLRPLMVAAVLAGGVLAAIFLLDPSSDSVLATYEELRAVEDPTWEQLARLVAVFGATAAAIVLVPLISFHIENSNCGMSLLPFKARRIASLAFAVAAIGAAAIAVISQSATVSSVAGVGLSLAASIASYFFGSNIDIDL